MGLKFDKRRNGIEPEAANADWLRWVAWTILDIGRRPGPITFEMGGWGARCDVAFPFGSVEWDYD